MLQLQRTGPARLGRRTGLLCRCPNRCIIQTARASAITPQKTAEEYSRLLKELSGDDDWTRTLELVAEINVLKIDIDPEALECAVASFARGGQWQRAENIYRQLQSRGHVPSSDTTTTLVAGMASSQQGQRAAELLAEFSTENMGTLIPAYNLVARALARQGLLDESCDMMSRMMRAELPVEAATFTCVAACCMNAERVDMAEELLEMRDYL